MMICPQSGQERLRNNSILGQPRWFHRSPWSFAHKPFIRSSFRSPSKVVMTPDCIMMLDWAYSDNNRRVYHLLRGKRQPLVNKPSRSSPPIIRDLLMVMSWEHNQQICDVSRALESHQTGRSDGMESTCCRSTGSLNSCDRWQRPSSEFHCRDYIVLMIFIKCFSNSLISLWAPCSVGKAPEIQLRFAEISSKLCGYQGADQHNGQARRKRIPKSGKVMKKLTFYIFGQRSDRPRVIKL